MYKALLSILLSVAVLHAGAQRATDTFKLYFDLGVPALNKQAEKKIDLLIYNDKIISGSNIMVIGYADYLGTEGYNKALSMKRAKNVKDYLVKYGVNAENITLCMGNGEVDRQGLTDRGGYPTDRRVDIVVNNRTRSTPPDHGKKKTDTTHKKTVTSVDDIKRLKPGATFLLKNVYFPPDRHIIKPESKETLEKLYMVLRDYPKLKISIEGHVCCVKDAADAWDIDTYEQLLSVNRAKAIYNYLVSRGIDSSRLRFAGFGRRHPVVADEQNEQDAELNRRVEIRVTDNK